MISLCDSPGYLGTLFLDQAFLELTEIHLCLPPGVWAHNFLMELMRMWPVSERRLKGWKTRAVKDKRKTIPE